jgi:hypothetical protein
VLKTSRVPQTQRRLRGKDDALDAVRTARAALASETLALPRRGERREALRLLLVARRSAVDVNREALIQVLRRSTPRSSSVSSSPTSTHSRRSGSTSRASARSWPRN